MAQARFPPSESKPRFATDLLSEELRNYIVEGKPYVIGREGHIYIYDEAISRHHAEIRVYKGRIILRDLGSTNGLNILKNKRLHPIKQGFVSPNDRILLGSNLYTPIQLLQKLHLFV